MYQITIALTVKLDIC